MADGTQVGYQEQTAATTVPQWYQDLYQNLLNRGAAQAGVNPAYGGALTAGFTPQQTQAGQMLQQQMGQWQPTYQSGLQQLQQSSQYNPAMYQQFMNPYQQDVVNEMARLGNQNLQQNILPTIADQFTSLGQFGSARQAQAIGRAAAETQRNITGQQAQALQQGYGQAMGLAGDWANRGMTGAQGLLSGAQLGQQLGQSDIQSLFGYGTQAQQTEQNRLNAQYQEWLRQQQVPMQGLTAWGGLFGAGKLPSTVTTTGTTGAFKRGGLIDLKATPTVNLVNSGQRALLGYAKTRGGKAVNFKKGGAVPPEDPSWKISNELQKERDKDRAEILGQELLDNPEDEMLKKEIAYEEAKGNPVPVVTAPALNTVPVDTDAEEETTPIAKDAMSSIAAQRMALVNDLLGQKRVLAERIRTDPNLAPIAEPDLTDRLARAVYEGAAAPAKGLGTFAGNVGTSYYANKDALAKENARRALLGYGLEEKLQDKISTAMSGMGGAGGVGQYKVVRANDGSTYMINSMDPTDRVLVPSGPNLERAQEATRKIVQQQMSTLRFPTPEEEDAYRKQLTANVFAEQLHRLQPQGAPAAPAQGAPAAPAQGAPAAPAQGAPAAPAQGAPAAPTQGAPAAPAQGAPAAPAAPAQGGIYTKTPESETYRSESGKASAKAFEDMQTKAQDAYTQMGDVDEMRSLLEGLNTGPAEPLVTEAKSRAENIIRYFNPNFRFGEGDVSRAQAAKALSNRLALNLRNPAAGMGMPGSLSDSDRVFLSQSVPGLQNSPEGNARMLEYTEKLLQRRIDVAEMAQRWREDHNGVFDQGAFTKHLRKWAEEHPLFPKKGGGEESQGEAEVMTGRRSEERR